MRLYTGIMCLLLVLHCVYAAPARHTIKRRALSDKTSDDKAENKQEHQKPEGSGDEVQQKDKKQFVPYVPAYNMGDVISEDSQPVQVVQIRDLSIANGVITKSNIVQL